MADLLSSTLSEQHAWELFRLEREEIQKFHEIYLEARLEILGRLEELHAERFEAQQLRYVLSQVQTGLDAMETRLGDAWKSTFTTAVDMAVAQKVSEIQFWDKKFKGRAYSRVRTQALRQMLGQKSLLLSQYDAEVAALRKGMEADIRRRLSIHLVRNSQWRTMSSDIAGRLKRNAIQGSKWKGERIVRTELVNVIGRADLITLGEAADEVDGLRMQWDAHFDSRTSDFCKGMHGTIRRPGEAFTQVGLGGYPVYHPPGHTWCRSRLVPWHSDWLDVEEMP